jgi:hypothetical protein
MIKAALTCAIIEENASITSGLSLAPGIQEAVTLTVHNFFKYNVPSN